jgi:hypothetical protein
VFVSPSDPKPRIPCTLEKGTQRPSGVTRAELVDDATCLFVKKQPVSQHWPRVFSSKRFAMSIMMHD